MFGLENLTLAVMVNKDKVLQKIQEASAC